MPLRYNGPVSMASGIAGKSNIEIEVVPESAALSAALNSHTFQKAPSLRALLKFLWDHRAEDLSEYAIAVDAFARPESFDPKIDATVRVQVSRLRQKLREYYDREGRADPQRLTIPIGKHRIELIGLEPEIIVPALDPIPVDDSHIRLKRMLIAAVCFAIFFAALSAALLLRRTSESKASLESLPPFWTRFLAPGHATKIVLPVPVFFNFGDSPLKVRDTRVNEYDQYPGSPGINLLAKQLGKPTLIQNYVASSDGIAAVRLVQFLDKYPLPLTVVSSPNFSLQDKEDSNFILLGTAGISTPFHDLLTNVNFEPVADGDLIRNRNPRPGEQKEYLPRTESPKRRTVPGYLGILPASGRGNRVLALIGVETMAIATCLTTPSCLDSLERIWKKEGSPTYFEAVVETKVDAGVVLSAQPLVLRRVESQKP